MGKFSKENLVEIPSDKGPVEFNFDKEFKNRVDIEKKILSGKVVYSKKPSTMNDPKDKSEKPRKIVKVDSEGNKVYPEIRSWFKDRKDGMYFNPQLSSLPILDDKGKGYKLEVGETPEDCLNDFINSVGSGEMKSQLDDFDKRREKRNTSLGEGRKKGKG